MNNRPNHWHLPLGGGLSQFSRQPEAVAANPHVTAAKMGLSPFRRLVRRSYTLVEILVALTLTLILMTAVVRVFGGVGEGIRKSRNALEQFDRLRTAVQQLNQDLNGVTARLDGRAGRPEESLGYFELVEGSYLFANTTANPPYYGVIAPSNSADYTVGQRGDILMFTSRNPARPFVGRYNPTGNSPQTIQSDVAEIAWFLRGNRLHRRVLLVIPGAAQALSQHPNRSRFYNDNDVSAHLVNGKIVPNSLADLTKREYRFGHPTWPVSPNGAGLFPFDVRRWGFLGLPTLAECSSPTWMANWVNGSVPPPDPALTTTRPADVDMWDNSPSGPFAPNTANNLSDQRLAKDGLRVADDVVLTNVIGFDVKVWEPAANGGAGGYVDLGSDEAGVAWPPVTIAPNKPNSFQQPQGPAYYRFRNGGIIESGLSASAAAPQRVYDTGCFSYENEGVYFLDMAGKMTSVPSNDQKYPSWAGKWPAGTFSSGFDDDNSGVVDDNGERITSLPYPVALRGIQIKIRCFEPDSKQIREITIAHDFLPK
jgi:type II secretory pathway component PulJ